jgi:ectoine hydroxylase-related dioxygenase (phytanoyl-CoA dioxygenase family)
VHFDALDRDGYAVIEDVLGARRMAIALDDIEGRLALVRDDPTIHVGGTLHVDLPSDDASPVADAWLDERVQAALVRILGGAAQASRAHFRAPLPGFGAQMLHRDTIAHGTPGAYEGATLIVALCDFGDGNGATRVVPGSQHSRGTPSLRDADTAHPDQRIVACPAGSVIVLNAHIWHSGTRNRSTAPRKALQISFARA